MGSLLDTQYVARGGDHVELVALEIRHAASTIKAHNFEGPIPQAEGLVISI